MSWAEVKHALNSTLGTEGFQALDKLISVRLAEFDAATKKTEFETAGSFSYTVPAGIFKLYIAAAAAGGGGSGATHEDNDRRCMGSGGGGGAAVLNYAIDVTPGQVITGTVGAGGDGGKTVNNGNTKPNPGKDGGNTIIDGILTLTGGKGATVTTESTNIYRTHGGAAGGAGGGKGGDGNYYDGSNYHNAQNGSAGIVGQGGAANSDESGGGGGSLGNGSTGNYYRDRGDTVVPPTKGGGGGGGTYTQGYAGDMDGLDGADGYVLFSVSPISKEEISGTKSGNIIKNIQRGRITTYNSGQYSITLSGFSDEKSMFVLLDFENSNSNRGFGISLMSLTTNELTVFVEYDDTSGSYQVIEFA